MKKLLLLLLAIPMLFISCQKEDIQPNTTNQGSVVRLDIQTGSPIVYLVFTYTDMTGVYHNEELQLDGSIENVDITKYLRVQAGCGVTGSLDPWHTSNYRLYIDNNMVDFQTVEIYDYQQ
jgi:hypothetical protein